MGKNSNSSSFSLVAFVFFIVGIFYFVIMLGTPGENRGSSFFLSIVITIVAGVFFLVS